MVALDATTVLPRDHGGTAVELLDARSQASTTAPPLGLGDSAVAPGRVDALARAARAATGEVLCFVPGPLEQVSAAWPVHLANALGGGVTAATPTIVHPERHGLDSTEHDLLVRSRGFTFEMDPEGVPTVRATGAGTEVDPTGVPADVVAAPLCGLVVEREAYDAVGGLASGFGDDDVAAAADLCARLRRAGGRVVHVPTAVVADARPVHARRRLREPVDERGPGWRRFLERNGADAARHARNAPRADVLRWVITTPVPARHVAPGWGDWHLAQALGRALRRIGHDVEVQTLDEADSLRSLAADVRLVVRGIAPVRRTAGQAHVLWVISHPDALDVAECDEADLVLVASERFAAHLRTRTSTPVAVMLQATDPDRFHPLPAEPRHRHPVTIVAKTRDVMRPCVADALAAGLRPAIYGGGWRPLVDPSLVVADHVANDELPVIYSSAGVVLNDHWQSMREWGFVSNRVFDVLACDTPLISDELPELRDLFGDAVVTYASAADLAARVAAALDDPGAARAAAARGGDAVRHSHTFDHRARELVALIDAHGLARTRK